ncbi:MAG: UvrB/UvrC motif-containing protein [candidate division WOR-3 bacterium]|jgi:protein arginine kinase activator
MRRCDLCGKREAALTIRQLDKEGKTTELAVCAECARKRGFTSVEDLKRNAAEIIAELKAKVADSDREVVCPRCKMSFADFKRLGRLGCAECYRTFAEQLQPLVRRLHSSVQHVGKSPQQGRKRAQERLEVQRLRAELEQAIRDEDYERAASLRDRLKKAGGDEIE